MRPVFTGQARSVVFPLGIRFGVAVMFDHRLAENAAEGVSGLLNNAGVGDDVNHPTLAVNARMFQSEGHARKRFAATGGNREGE